MFRRTSIQKPIFGISSAQNIFSRKYDFANNRHAPANVLETQVRNTTISNLGRMRVNMSRITKKIDDMIHPHPTEKEKKFSLKKRYVRPPGETKAAQIEKNKELNPAGTSKPQKMSERDRELISAIYECGNSHQPELAIEAYRRLSIVPDVKCFTAILKSCELNGAFLGEALEIYQDMKKINTPSNIGTFTALLNVCIAANHWQRAMFVLKEMLVRAPPTKEISKPHMKFFRKLLGLLYKNGQDDRIAYVYTLMLKYKYVSAASRAAVPVEFVQMFIPKLSEAQEYLEKKLMGALDPSKRMDDAFTSHHNLIDSTMEYKINPLAYKARAQLERGNRKDALSIRTATMLENILNFNLVFEDKEAERGFKGMYNELLEEFLPEHIAAIKGEEYDDGTAKSEEALPGVPQKLANQKLAELQVELGAAKWRKGYDLEALAEIEEAYEEKKAALRNDLVTKLPWKPVIVGVDGKPFFPTQITVHRITGETVRAAKQEYLNSISDVAVRQQVEEMLKDRIRLCWYSTKTGKLVQGLFY